MADALTFAEMTFEERLALGKQREAEVLERLQHSFWSVIPATEAQDKVDKIDAWVRWKGVSYSVGVKWRDSGVDLGIAAVRPFVDRPTLNLQWNRGEVPWDRDAQHYCDLYAVGKPDGVTVYTGASVKVMVDNALSHYINHGMMKTALYEIKIVEDRGASGYTAGQKKLIVYIRLDSLQRIEV